MLHTFTFLIMRFVVIVCFRPSFFLISIISYFLHLSNGKLLRAFAFKVLKV